MHLSRRVVQPETKITIKRLLPFPGEVLVQPGQVVQPLQTIARAEIPRRYHVLNIAHYFARPNLAMHEVMLKGIGEPVAVNEPLAVFKGKLPFLQKTVRAPAEGRIAAIGPGWVLLETERTVTETQAFVNGVISQIIPQWGVIIEAQGAVIEAACGFGGEAYGRLRLLVQTPFDTVTETVLDQEEVEQAILVIGRSVTEAFLRQAEARQVRGLIVGGIDAALLNLDPPSRVRVVATEGFGDLAISPPVFTQLTALQGRAVSIRGQTRPLASAIHGRTKTDTPLIMATVPQPAPPAPPLLIPSVEVGCQVRVLRGFLLGRVGRIRAMPTKPQATTGGLIAPGAYVTIDGRDYFMPWANLEIVG